MSFQDKNGVTYTREYIASNPARVVAARYTASEAGKINLRFSLASGKPGVVAATTYEADGGVFSGKLETVSYNARFKVVPMGGTMKQTAEGIEVKDADEVLVILAGGTDFDAYEASYIKHTAQLATTIQARVNDAAKLSWNALYDAHVKDFQKFFNRVDFQLAGTKNLLPTNKLIDAYNGGKGADALMLEKLYFAYGRYLEISSSRGVDLPANLQGIWSNITNPAWNADIHANINVQMNYWPAEPTNLSECHLPFLEYIYNEATRKDGGWQLNARDLGIKRGWVVNTAGNIFGGSSQYKAGKYAVANAWFCEHLWQHFTYTCDTTYLRQTAFPVMKSACEFWFDRLVEAPDGTLECPNEYSPEQGFIQNATAHGQQLVTQLFLNMQQALKVLGDGAADKAFKQELTDKLNRIDRGLRVNDKGMLREWKYQGNTPNQPANQNHFAHDEENIWQCHRHTSHLMALYPGFEIDPGKDKNIFHAAKASLQDRGETGTGWALAWRISLWSRAREAQKAYSLLRHFATHTDVLSYNWYGGLYDNMLDAHATSVFQIEGNFGATAGISEMLLQSRPDSTVLLPALPAEWQEGHIKGLKTIGNFEISLDWKEHRLTKVRIHTLKGGPITLAYPGIQSAQVKALRRKAGRRVLHTEQINNKPNQLLLVTKPGETYELIFQ